MVRLREYLTVIGFCWIITVVQSSQDIYVLRHSASDNGTTRKLTCVSQDDDAALIWNYNPNVNKEQDFTNFEPKKPPSKNFGECAVWNATKCLAPWGDASGWGVANSSQRPMGPVFDYRWEGFEEFVPNEFVKDQEYQYVGKIEPTQGTAVFSVRGLRKISIFLCKNKNPAKRRRCIRIVIGSSRGKKSAIKSCFEKATNHRQTAGKNKCVEIAKAVHESERIVDAYEWRTFILEWSEEDKVIRVFKESEVKPFLEGKLDPWQGVPNLFVQSPEPSRVRFHFYEYFLAEEKGALISTREFLHQDKNFCVDLFVGLCPECRLNVTLVDSKGDDIPIAVISGGENSVHGELVAWRSVRLNTALSNFDTQLVKLKVVTVPEIDQVGGFWAIDNFRICKSFAGLRESTITTHIAKLNAPFWPIVNCQKLSYTGSRVVKSLPSYPNLGTNRKHLFAVTPEGNGLRVNVRKRSKMVQDRGVDHRLVPVSDTAANVMRNFSVADLAPVSKTNGGILLSRKTRDSDTQDKLGSVKIDIYEADPEENTISVRLSPFPPAEIGIDEYRVSVIIGSQQDGRFFYQNSEKLKCTLWENSVCFEKYSLPSYIKLTNANSDTNNYVIKVEGLKKKELQGERAIRLALDLYTTPSSAPTNLTITSKGHGIMEVKWQHPWLPKQKINEFKIRVSYLQTKLSGYQHNPIPPKIYPVEQEKKEYSLELYLRTSTQYQFDVMVSRKGKDSSEAATETKWLPSGVAFADGEKLHMTGNGTLIKLERPKVINATIDTTISVVVKGTLMCTPTSSLPNRTEWIAAEYNITEYELENLTEIGGDQNIKTSSNCALHVGETYTIKVRVKDEDFHDDKSGTITLTSSSFKSDDDPTAQNFEQPNQILIRILYALIAIAVLALMTCLLIWCRRRRSARMETNKQGIRLVLNTDPSKDDHAPEQSTPPLKLASYRSSNRHSTPDVVPYDDADSHSVKVEDFEEYVKKALSTGLLDMQYEQFPRGLHKPCKYGTLPDNLPKNRYKDTTAYDHSRVILEKVSGDRHSDYINANYIHGYNKKKAYIAAQGPKATTVRDFWRMIWQKEVRVICMLANVKEGGKTKCEKYWPEVGTNAKYGDVIITNIGHQVFADYTFRKFRLDCKKAQRNVTHLHYTGWPDHGVPMYTQSLVSYIKKLQDTDAGDAPVVIHCSAGVGRTGTIILCHACLSQANATKMINVPTVMAKMREDRANMVDSKQQYLLAHLTIVESMLPAPTQLPCNSALEARIKELRVQLPSDIQRLNDTVWQDRALHSLAAPRQPEDVTKDPVLEQGAQGEAESEFPPRIKGEDNEINAVSVDGVKMKTQYLASQLPSSSTLPEFWKLIAEKRIELIVILQRPEPGDSKFCDIIPTESVTTPVPHIEVEAKTLPIQDDYFSVNKLSLTDNSRQEKAKPQPVTVLTCTGWACRKEGNLPTATALVSLWIASEKISRKESPTLVLCCDGVTGCGLYLALSFLLERMAVERECDVISAVRAVRRSNPEFVQKLEQFEHLYDAAVSYIKCFDTYSNFS